MSGNMIAALEPRLLRIETNYNNILEFLKSEKDNREAFEKRAMQKIDQCFEILTMLVMNSKKGNNERKKGEDDVFNVYAEAQCGTIRSILTGALLCKTAVHVFSRSIVDFVCRSGYSASKLTMPLQLMFFAPHPSIKKQAALTEIGSNFNRMKMRLVQKLYIEQCL